MQLKVKILSLHFIGGVTILGGISTSYLEPLFLHHPLHRQVAVLSQLDSFVCVPARGEYITSSLLFMMTVLVISHPTQAYSIKAPKTMKKHTKR